MMFSVSNVVMQSSINSFNSSDIIAGNTAGSNLENFCYIAMMAFTQACVSFTSQNYGARKYEKLRKIMYQSLALVVIGSLAVSGAIWAFHKPLLSTRCLSRILMSLAPMTLAARANSISLRERTWALT